MFSLPRDKLRMERLSEWLVLLVFISFVAGTSRGQAFSQKVPIGAMFGHSSSAIRNGFTHAIAEHNTVQTKLRLQAATKLQQTDAYMVGTTMCNLMSNGIFALFSTHDMGTINTFKSYTSTFKMPFVTPSMAVNTSGQELGYELYMRPYYAKAIVDMITHYRWTEVWYTYNNDEGLMRVQQIFDVLSEESRVVKINLLRVANAEEANITLSRIDSARDKGKKILLDLPTKECEKLIASVPKTARASHSYFLVGLGIQEMILEDFTIGGVNLTGFLIVQYNNQTVEKFLKEWALQDPDAFPTPGKKIPYESALAVDSVNLIGSALLKMISPDRNPFRQTLREGKVFNNGTEGINCDADPVVPWQHGYNIMKTMREMEFHGLTGKIAFDKFGLRRDYKLDVLEINMNRGLAKIASWHSGRGLKIEPPSMVRNKGNNTIANKTRIITSILTAPYLVMRQSPPGGKELVGNDRFEGYCADLARWLSNIVGFDYKIVTVKDAKYGSAFENGSWNGMVGELVRHTDPFLMLKADKPGDPPLTGNDRYEGYCVDVAEKLARLINTKFIIKPVEDRKYGQQDELGNWDGMVRDLMINEADLAIAPLTITSQREQVIDFSKPFMSLGISIMIKKPTEEVPGVFSFMAPLSYEIWMCVIFAYIGVSVVLFLVSRFSPFEWHIEDNSDGPTVTNNFTIFNSLWFSLGAFMQQGCDIEPRSMSGRIVGSVWWFFTLIIISSYTANLAAFLTVERMQSPIESADDLAKQTEIKYGTVDSGSTKEFFKTSTIPVYERMWAFMSSAEPSVFTTGNEDGVQRVRTSNGRYAFLMESASNDYINQRQPCDTMKVGSNLDSKGYGVGTPLGSDLRDRITLAVLEMRESGELAKLEKKWWYDKGECGMEQGKKEDATSALKLQNVAGIFYILVSGLCFGLLIAILEFMYKSQVEARRRKTSFSNAVRQKARLSIKGKPERQTTAVGSHAPLPANMSMSTYTYAPAAQLISLDGYADANTHTQV